MSDFVEIYTIFDFQNGSTCFIFLVQIKGHCSIASVSAFKKLKLPDIGNFGLGGNKSSSMIGVDISSSAVKVLELGRSSSGFRVERIGVDSLPPNAIVESSIADIEAVSDSVSRAVSRSGTKCRDAVIAVPASHVITKSISLPADLSGAELDSQIMFDAARYIPYPLEEVNLDYVKMGPSPEKPKEDEYLLVACRKEVVDDYVAVVSTQGIRPAIVDVETYAVENAVANYAKSSGDGSLDGVVAVLDFGAVSTHLTVLKNTRTVYARDHAFGGRLLTDEIQRVYGLSYGEAGMAKKTLQLPEGYEEEVFEPFRESMAQEAVRALQFFYSSTPYNAVDRILLAGGTSLVHGAAELLGERLDAPVMLFNPFQYMSVSKNTDADTVKAESSSMLVACGLALRSFDE